MLAYVQQILQEETEKEQLDINDLATTLLVVLVTSKRLAAMQIGDGFIVFKPLGGIISYCCSLTRGNTSMKPLLLFLVMLWRRCK